MLQGWPLLSPRVLGYSCPATQGEYWAFPAYMSFPLHQQDGADPVQIQIPSGQSKPGGVGAAGPNIVFNFGLKLVLWSQWYQQRREGVKMCHGYQVLCAMAWLPVDQELLSWTTHGNWQDVGCLMYEIFAPTTKLSIYLNAHVIVHYVNGRTK